MYTYLQADISENHTIPSEASDFVKFVNNAPSPFHAVEEARLRLVGAGFEEIKERDSWVGKLNQNGKYFFTRNKSTILAFSVGGKYVSGNGFSMIGAHTDSPCLKIKPISKKSSAGYLQVGVETYGGGICTKEVESLNNDPNIRLIVLFDNEEVGSQTAHGADSKLLEAILRRLTYSNIGAEPSSTALPLFIRIIGKALYLFQLLIGSKTYYLVTNSEKYEENHRPQMHKGVVIKVNANQRYTTTAATSVILREAAKKYQVPLQEFCVRADSACGSTIGPMISANLGLRTV
ncbi:4852_t:CDS:2, partial [Acaulospora colombiana]